jgi:GTPase Era involved in 16S rRNA processing
MVYKMGNDQSSINNTIKIGVIGLEKSGKSTLLNKLIGQDILLTSDRQNKEQNTNINVLIKNTMSEKPELLANNMIVAEGIDDVSNAIRNINQNTDNNDNLLILRTKIKSLHDINSTTIEFYDTLGLERTKSTKGKIVMNIVTKCEVILYVLNFQDLIYNAIFRQYELLKKYKKRVYVIVTHPDLFVNNESFNSNMKIKNTVLSKYIGEGIKLNPDDIIPLNLLETNNDNFQSFVNIINNVKIELENTKLKERLERVEDYQNGQIIGDIFGIGVNLISNIAKR